MTENPIEESAALYLAGALTPEEYSTFEAQLNAGWAEGSTALLGMQAAVRAIVVTVPPIAPRAAVKDGLLQKLKAIQLPGIRFRFADDDEFVQTPYAGVAVRILNKDRERKQFTFLMRLQPGASYPSHPHDGPEECLVLEGEIVVDGVRMKKGDYQRAEPGHDHCDQFSDTGALLYITAPLALLDF